MPTPFCIICTGLKLPLHAYQRHALAWMCWRERIGAGQDSASPRTGPGAGPMLGSPNKAGSSLDDSVDAETEAMFGARRGPGGQSLHPCWQPVTLPSGLHVFENRFTGHSHYLVLPSKMLWVAADVQVAMMSLLVTDFGHEICTHQLPQLDFHV